MVHRTVSVTAATVVLLLSASAWAIEDIPANRAQQIFEAAPTAATARPAKPRRVLIWNTPSHLLAKDPHKGYCSPYGAAAMKTLGAKTGAFASVMSEDVSVFLPENIKQFDAIIFNNACGQWISPSDEAMTRIQGRGDKQAVEKVLRQSLLDWVNQGGGIVAYHFAHSANKDWPEFRELIGAKGVGHPWDQEVGIKIDEPAHPLNAAFGGKGFRLSEEVFQFVDPYSREELRVLISIDTAQTDMTVKGLVRTDGDYGLAWVKAYGKGRVFYTSLGHRTQLYWNPMILRFYLDGIQFVMGDLDAPIGPLTGGQARPAPALAPPAATAPASSRAGK